MGTARRLLLFLFAGALTGDIVATLVSPGFIVWYETPSDPSGLCKCIDIARDTASRLIRYQLIGALAGALLLLIIGILFLRSRGRHPPPMESATPAPPQ